VHAPLLVVYNKPPPPKKKNKMGHLGPGFEQLLDQLTKEGVDEAAERHLIPWPCSS
jgi:hypothetical protein